jgi:serine protease SohB
VVVAILVIIAFISAMASKSKEQGKLAVTKVNQKYHDTIVNMDQETSTKAALKASKKERQLEKKKEKELAKIHKNRLFVLNFQGDIRASAVANLREEITAILLTIKPRDEVIVKLDSPGGIVNAYGLAASQLKRLKDANVKLTVAIDKVAASGGYMMAAVADQIIAAPFSIIGSIGVVVQLPNFNRLLKKHDIDFEQITAGQFKRTLSLFGENTDEGKNKMKEEIHIAHELFKTFIREHRPQVDVDRVATGEYWFAANAMELRLVDKLETSDDYLLQARDRFDIYEIQYKIKRPLSKRISMGAQNLLGYLVNGSA